MFSSPRVLDFELYVYDKIRVPAFAAIQKFPVVPGCPRIILKDDIQFSGPDRQGQAAPAGSLASHGLAMRYSVRADVDIKPATNQGELMSKIFAKLNLSSQQQILVLNSPVSFEPELAFLKDVKILTDLKQAKDISFALIFAQRQTEVDRYSKLVAAKAKGDAMVWFAYPKGSSRKYQCDFNRDTGWKEMTRLGFETVRMVAIDEDWSALRFRRKEFVGS
jgi:hypothetical protein